MERGMKDKHMKLENSGSSIEPSLFHIRGCMIIPHLHKLIRIACDKRRKDYAHTHREANWN